MANKKFRLGMLVMVLVFGMTVIGCDNDGGGADTPTNETAGITTEQRATVDTAFQSVTITPPGTGGLASNQVRLTGLAAGFQYNIGLGNSAPSATAGWQSPNSALIWTISSGSGQAALWVRAIGNTTVGVRVGAIQGANITQPSDGNGDTNWLSLYDWSTGTPSGAALTAGGITEEQFNQIRDAGGVGGFFGWRLDLDADELELVWTGRSVAHFSNLAVELDLLRGQTSSGTTNDGVRYVSGLGYRIDFYPSRKEIYDPQYGIVYISAGNMILLFW